MKNMILRIGSMDYEPSAAVKPHTLDQRLIETLNFKRLYDNKAQQEHADALLAILAVSKEATLNMDDPR